LKRANEIKRCVKSFSIALAFLAILPAITFPIDGDREENEFPHIGVVEEAFPKIEKKYPIDEIRFPLSAVPVILERGSTFEAEIDISAHGIEPDDWGFYIASSNSEVVYEYELGIERVVKNEGRYDITLRVPTNVFEGLYDLYMVAYGEEEIWDRQPRAVSVAEIDGDFTFVHWTDPHLGDFLRQFTGGMEQGYGIQTTLDLIDGWELAQKSIDEVNLIHPDFVLITGDIVYGFIYKYEYPVFYELLQKFDAPTFVFPGNHDVDYILPFMEDGCEFYQRYVGPMSYSFDYGEAHFTMANSNSGTPDLLRLGVFGISLTVIGWISDEQFRWIEEDLKANQDAELRFLCLHHTILHYNLDKIFPFPTIYDWWVGDWERMMGIIARNNVSYVLYGHGHEDWVDLVGNTTFIETTSCGAGAGEYWGYRIIEVEDWEVASYNYKEPRHSVPIFKLEAEYEEEDGYINEAEYTNDLDMDLEILLKFYIPLGEYEIDSESEIVSVQSREGAESQEVLIIISAEAGSEGEVSIDY